MISDWKWLAGTIIGIMFVWLGATIESQRATDQRQDNFIGNLNEEARETRASQQRTAEALAQVAAIVNQMDLRGTQALDEHEREVRNGTMPK